MVKIIFEWLKTSCHLPIKSGATLVEMFSNGRMFGKIFLSKNVMPKSECDKLVDSSRLRDRTGNISLLLPYLVRIGVEVKFCDIKGFILHKSSSINYLVYQVYMALKEKDADEFEPCKIVDSEEIENLRHQLKSLEIELLKEKNIASGTATLSRHVCPEMDIFRDDNTHKTSPSFVRRDCSNARHGDGPDESAGQEREVTSLPPVQPVSQTEISQELTCESFDGKHGKDTYSFIKNMRKELKAQREQKFSIEKERKRRFVKNYLKEEQERKIEEEEQVVRELLEHDMMCMQEAAELAKKRQANLPNVLHDKLHSSRNPSMRHHTARHKHHRSRLHLSHSESQNMSTDNESLQVWRRKRLLQIEEHEKELSRRKEQEKLEVTLIGEYVTNFCFDLSVRLAAFRERTNYRPIPEVLFRECMEKFSREEVLFKANTRTSSRVTYGYFLNTKIRKERKCFEDYMHISGLWHWHRSELEHLSKIRELLNTHNLSTEVQVIQRALKAGFVIPRHRNSVLESVNFVTLVGKPGSGKSLCLKQLSQMQRNFYVTNIAQLVVEAIATARDQEYIDSGSIGTSLKQGFSTEDSSKSTFLDSSRLKVVPNVGGNGYLHSCIIPRVYTKKITIFGTSSKNDAIAIQKLSESGADIEKKDDIMIYIGTVARKQIETTDYVDSFILSLLALEWIESLPQGCVCVIEGFPCTVEQSKVFHYMSYTNKHDRINVAHNLSMVDTVLSDQMYLEVFGDHIGGSHGEKKESTYKDWSHLLQSFIDSRIFAEKSWWADAGEASKLHLIVELHISDHTSIDRTLGYDKTFSSHSKPHELILSYVSAYRVNLAELLHHFPIQSNVSHINGELNTKQVCSRFMEIIDRFKERKLSFMLNQKLLQLRSDQAVEASASNLEETLSSGASEPEIEEEEQRRGSAKNRPSIRFSRVENTSKSHQTKLSFLENNEDASSETTEQEDIPPSPKPPFPGDPSYRLIDVPLPLRIFEVLAVVWAVEENKYVNSMEEKLHKLGELWHQCESYLEKSKHAFSDLINSTDNRDELLQQFIDFIKDKLESREDSDDSDLKSEIDKSASKLEKEIFELVQEKRRKAEEFRYIAMISHRLKRRIGEMCSLWAAVMQTEEKLSATIAAIIDTYFTSCCLQLHPSGVPEPNRFQPHKHVIDVSCLINEMEFDKHEQPHADRNVSLTPSVMLEDEPNKPDTIDYEPKLHLNLDNLMTSRSKMEAEHKIESAFSFMIQACVKIQHSRKKIFLRCVSFVKRALRSQGNIDENVGDSFGLHQYNTIHIRRLARLLAEYVSAVDQENARFSMRLSVIRSRAHFELRSLRARAINMFHNMQVKLNEQYCLELDSVREMKSYLAEVSTLKHPISVRPNFIDNSFVFKRCHDTSETTIFLDKHYADFTLEQVRALWRHFSRAAPSGTMSRHSFSLLLQDLIVVGSEEREFPESWMSFKSAEIEQLSRELSSGTEVISWRRFLYDILLPLIPKVSLKIVKDISSKLSRNFGQPKNVSIEEDAKWFFWFDDEELASGVDGSALKHLLLQISGNNEGSYISLVQLLLFVCRSNNAEENFLKALHLVRKRETDPSNLPSESSFESLGISSTNSSDNHSIRFSADQDSMWRKSAPTSTQSEPIMSNCDKVSCNFLSDPNIHSKRFGDHHFNQENDPEESNYASSDYSYSSGINSSNSDLVEFSGKQLRKSTKDNGYQIDSVGFSVLNQLPASVKPKGDPGPDYNVPSTAEMLVREIKADCCCHPAEKPRPSPEQFFHCRRGDLFSLEDVRDLLRHSLVYCHQQQSDMFRHIDVTLAELYEDILGHNAARTVFALEHNAYLPISAKALLGHKSIVDLLESNCILNVFQLEAICVSVARNSATN